MLLEITTSAPIEAWKCFHAFLGKYGKQTDQPTNQPNKMTDMRSYREVTLPKSVWRANSYNGRKGEL